MPLTKEQVQRIRTMARYEGSRLQTRRVGKQHPQIWVSAPGHGEQNVGEFWPTELPGAFDGAKKVFHAAKGKAATV